jgi:hypothetical protein
MIVPVALEAVGARQRRDWNATGAIPGIESTGVSASLPKHSSSQATSRELLRRAGDRRLGAWRTILRDILIAR